MSGNVDGIRERCLELFQAHRPMLKDAAEATAIRGHWSPFPEVPSPRVYGDAARADGMAAVAALVGTDYPLAQPGERARIATERSPYGVRLDIRYPDCDARALLAAAVQAEPAWQAIGAKGRTGVLLEALTRLHGRSHELARAVMLTTGQGEMMAFQAGGPHAQDRALEAIASAWRVMNLFADEARWEKPQGKKPPLSMRKHFEIVGRGVAVVIGCATFPTWNTYPGLFAALATGNPVIVKPHPNAVLPAAITVGVLRSVLAEQGLDPGLVSLAICPDPEETRRLCTDERVTSIDFTGGSAFGRWLIDNARQARVYAEMSGLNTVVVESTDDYAGMLRNLAFSLSLYSGQMCTTPQNLLVPKGGIATNEGPRSFEQFSSDLAAAIDDLLTDVDVATTVLGAIGSEATLDRLAAVALTGKVVRRSRKIEHPLYPDAQVRTPLLVALEQADAQVFEKEWFGPITFIVATASAQVAIDLARTSIGARGALTLAVHSTSPEIIEEAIAASRRARVALSINLTGSVFVNQSAAFSDFHASGGNPASNASYTSAAFVADRFVVVPRREHMAVAA